MTERLILRALLALTKAQLRQKDFLMQDEVNELEQVRDALQQSDSIGLNVQAWNEEELEAENQRLRDILSSIRDIAQ